jgi:hypothetical protein
VDVTSFRLLLSAGSVAATLVGAAPALPHGASASGPARLAPASTVTVVVPTGVTHLAPVLSGSPALASRARVTVTRSADGATIFMGSLATLRSLPVVAGTKLVVHVSKPVGFDGLRASATVAWS